MTPPIESELFSAVDLPHTMQLDRSFNFGLSSDGEQIIKQQYFSWQELSEKIIINGNVTIQNKGNLKFQDIFLKYRIKIYDAGNNVTLQSFHDMKYQTTGKGETQSTWILPDGEFIIHTNGKLMIELICTRVYEFNDGGKSARFGGAFNIVENSKIVIEKK